LVDNGVEQNRCQTSLLGTDVDVSWVFQRLTMQVPMDVALEATELVGVNRNVAHDVAV
jgi:hypothetical protein